MYDARVVNRAGGGAWLAMAALRRTPLIAMLLVILFVVACFDGPAHPEQAAEPQVGHAAPVTVSWSFWGDDWSVEINRRLVTLFEREHPTIRVQTVHRPWREYFDWLRTEWRAGRAPDVMFLNFIPAYAPLGELEPLDDYVARDSLDLADFYPALLEGFRAGDRLYGLPRDNDTKVIYFNRTHFREAGLPVPSDSWTWDDLRRAARALTHRDAAVPRYGLGLDLDLWWMVWLWQSGCPVLDSATAPSTTLLDGAACAGALQFLQNLITVDRVTPPLETMTTETMSRLFRDGQLSMMFGNHALVPGFANTAELEWEVAPLPRGSDRANVAGGAGFVLSRRSEQKEAGWALIRFLTGPKAQAVLAESGAITPARRSVREDSIFLRQQRYRADVFRSESAVGRPIPTFPGSADFNRLMSEGLQPVWRGERHPAEVLQELAPRAQRIIDESRKR